VRYRFLKDHQHEHRISTLCRVLQVSRSGYYAWRVRPEGARAAENRRLLLRIRSIHARSREAYGAVKTRRALRDDGIDCGRHRLARLRQTHGIVAKRARRFRLSYAARNSEPAAPNLLDRHFTAHQPNRVWVGDITFIHTREGWLHLAVLLDLYSRKVVGWAMSDRQNRQLAIDALVMAIERRRPEPGLVHHTDQGMLYATPAYRAILAQHGMIPSMSRKGDCYDNAVAESFFSNLKNELLWDRDLRTRSEARSAVFEWIEVFYNRERLHQTLDYVSPVRYEEQSVCSLTPCL
jgi:transposase InsO family protein